RGELLPDDRYEEWSAERRDALAAAHRQLLAEWISWLEAEGARDEPLAAARPLLLDDPADETANRDLMRLEAMRGNRTGALRAFDALRARLRADLGVEPAAETIDLQEAIAAGRIGPAPAPTTNLPGQVTSFI